MGRDRIEMADIEAARLRLAGTSVRTPLLELEDVSEGRQVYLKLENPSANWRLQDTWRRQCDGSGTTQLARARRIYGQRREHGPGCRLERRLGIACTVIVPDHAPEAKLDAISRFGARIIPVPFEEWWRVIVTSEYPGIDGSFVHPVSDPAVIAGNGTIGLEIFEDLPDLDTVIVPYGGGGLISGIATALRELAPAVRIMAAEVETAAPLAPALAKGMPVEVDYEPSFVDGIGSTSVLDSMWPMVERLVHGSIVVSLDEIRAAIRMLMKRAKIVAEGAGATSLAAALTGRAGEGKIVCVVSGGNINMKEIVSILGDEL